MSEQNQTKPQPPTAAKAINAQDQFVDQHDNVITEDDDNQKIDHLKASQDFDLTNFKDGKRTN